MLEIKLKDGSKIKGKDLQELTVKIRGELEEIEKRINQFKKELRILQCRRQELLKAVGERSKVEVEKAQQEGRIPPDTETA